MVWWATSTRVPLAATETNSQLLAPWLIPNGRVACAGDSVGHQASGLRVLEPLQREPAPGPEVQRQPDEHARRRGLALAGADLQAARAQLVEEVLEPCGGDDLEDPRRADGPPDPEELGTLAARYGLELDFESIPGLMERFGVVFGPEVA